MLAKKKTALLQYMGCTQQFLKKRHESQDKTKRRKMTMSKRKLASFSSIHNNNNNHRNIEFQQTKNAALQPESLLDPH